MQGVGSQASRVSGRAALALLAAAIAAPTFGATCEGDLNGDGIVDGADLAIMFANFGLAGSSADVNGDGIVDGGDLGKMLSNWGVCGPTCDSYQSLNFVGKVVGGFGEPLPITVLNGTVTVLPSGEPQGALNIISYDGSSMAMNLALAQATVFIDTSVVSFPASGPSDLASIDGSPVTIAAILDSFAKDLLSALPPGQWSVAGRSALAFAALVETEPFCCDLNMALADATASSTAFWCKSGCVGLSASIVAKAVDGCEDIDGSCGADTTTKVGKFDMPCDTVSPLCIDSNFAGSLATFKAILGLWMGQ
ncbi:MAG: hypothetical protein U0575_07760 [Phycisphaerales bacterium]|jgi:hypothetical protein